MNSLLQTDGYKVDHKRQYPEGTTKVYSNWTPRKSRMANITDGVVFVGLQGFIKKHLIEGFQRDFFDLPLDQVTKQFKRRIDNYLGPNEVGTQHIKDLHDLGYLPIEIMALPEGTLVPIRVPMFTMHNTHDSFFWLTNFLETLVSCELWGPSTSATLARHYNKILSEYARMSSTDENFVQFQGHDFSMRGMYGIEAAQLSGFGHLTSFVGTDTLPAIEYAEKYYNADCENEMVGVSVPATEHSVMCAGGDVSEFATFKRLITEVYPTGILSIVSDTWDLWTVLKRFLPKLKNEIINRDGKVVIRPDSGDPVDILCGTNGKLGKGKTSESKGVIELLYDVFGGERNEKGYIELPSYIGAIYGDAITPARSHAICTRLMEKGFASTNVVLGIGSFTYQYNTRDTFGFAMKATYVEINGVGREIYKDPITDDGTKKSAKGLVKIVQRIKGKDYGNKNSQSVQSWDDKYGIALLDQQSWDDVYGDDNLMKTIYKDGKLLTETSLEEIRKTIKNG